MPDQPSLRQAPELASGPNFHVSEPLESDGLMHHFVIDGHRIF
jgi:hypothetical protein